MKIQIPDITFKHPPSKRNMTNCIVLHHADAPTCTIEQIHGWHLNNGWSGVGYHYFVRKDGSVWVGRPDDTIGAHASGGNSDSIGICFEGNYEIETSMPDAQKAAGKELVAYLKNKYKIATVKKHSAVTATSCPGKYFPFYDIASASGNVAAEEPEKPAYKNGSIEQLQDICNRLGYSSQKVDGIAGPVTLAGCRTLMQGDKGDLVKWLQIKLKKLGYKPGAADGVFDKKTKAAVKAFQQDRGLLKDGIAGKKTWSKILGM